MKILWVKADQAVCEAGGIHRKVNILLIEESLQPGDYLLVHVGYAIEKLEPAHAEETLRLLAQMRAGGDAATA
jgi:hydrogenase expression/formation protein HypC